MSDTHGPSSSALDIVNEARSRFRDDAEFAAVVRRAARVANQAAVFPMDSRTQSLFEVAASVALVVREKGSGEPT